MSLKKNEMELKENGYSILNKIFSDSEIQKIINCIENTELDGNSFYKTKELFAIRQLLNKIPALKNLIFNSKLKELISQLIGQEYFLTKSIYFDKPTESNWFVAFHQDLSISVDKKVELEGYQNWTFKKGQYGVQPPTNILEETITIRIHLDDTTSENGALRVIPDSHLNGVVRQNSDKWNILNEYICEVKRGGVMLMNPLLLHASNRTTNGKKRRVIHIEINRNNLDEPLKWLENSFNH